MPDPYARYDYAWQTPAWTVQDPVINYATDGYVDPGLPEDISLVRVFGSFLELDSGRSLEGVLRLRVNKILTHVPSGQQVLSGAMRPIRFKRDGFSLMLPATNDPQLSPEFEYEARLTVLGITREFAFDLPMGETEVNLLTKIPVGDQPEEDVTYYFDGGTP